MASKKDTTLSKKKDKYRIRNWRQYNQSLVNRGSITFWFNEDAIQKWYSVDRTEKRGRPETYSDDAICCGLMIRAVFRTANDVSDDEAMVEMMAAIDEIPLGDVIGDGAYDTIDCREAIFDRGGRQVIPPDRNAKKQKKKDWIPALAERDEAIKRIEELGEEGRSIWKEEVGYHRRSPSALACRNLHVSV
jgi:hypothetical protein